MATDRTAKAEAQGKKASEEGIGLNSCPYKNVSKQRTRWKKGWWQANRAADPNLAVIPSDMIHRSH